MLLDCGPALPIWRREARGRASSPTSAAQNDLNDWQRSGCSSLARMLLDTARKRIDLTDLLLEDRRVGRRKIAHAALADVGRRLVFAGHLALDQRAQARELSQRSAFRGDHQDAIRDIRRSKPREQRLGLRTSSMTQDRS